MTNETTRKYNYNTVEEALTELQAGHIVLVTDDPDRENEGDFICAGQFCTVENLNFMATHGKGLICMPMSISMAHKLGLPQMVSENTDNHCTAFTVSIDHVNTTTGISAVERAGLRALNEGQKVEFQEREERGKVAAVDLKPL